MDNLGYGNLYYAPYPVNKNSSTSRVQSCLIITASNERRKILHVHIRHAKGQLCEFTHKACMND